RGSRQRGSVHQRVRLVGLQLMAVDEDALVPADPPQLIDEAVRAQGRGRYRRPYVRCSGFSKPKWQPASHSVRELPCAGMPPTSLSIRARCMRFHVMKAVLRLVK